LIIFCAIEARVDDFFTVFLNIFYLSFSHVEEFTGAAEQSLVERLIGVFTLCKSQYSSKEDCPAKTA
jgi:hypothetical protein